jgi:hypothetical protein
MSSYIPTRNTPVVPKYVKCLRELAEKYGSPFHVKGPEFARMVGDPLDKDHYAYRSRKAEVVRKIRRAVNSIGWSWEGSRGKGTAVYTNKTRLDYPGNQSKREPKKYKSKKHGDYSKRLVDELRRVRDSISGLECRIYLNDFMNFVDVGERTGY